MSKQAIYDYLISQYSGRFEKKATKYAIHNLDADYNANALKTTESIQETMTLSLAEIKDMLTAGQGYKFTKKKLNMLLTI